MIRQVTFENADVAERVLIKLTSIAEHCGSATIGDLYEQCPHLTNSRPDNSHGWYPHQMYRAYVREFGGRYILRLPEPVLIEEHLLR